MAKPLVPDDLRAAVRPLPLPLPLPPPERTKAGDPRCRGAQPALGGVGHGTTAPSCDRGPRGAPAREGAGRPRARQPQHPRRSKVRTPAWRSLAQTFRRPAVVVLDKAGWHVAGALKVPDNATLAALPAHSPQLNPVERGWLHVRERHLSHRLLDGHDETATPSAGPGTLGGRGGLRRPCGCPETRAGGGTPTLRNVARLAFDNWAEHEEAAAPAPMAEMALPWAKSARQVPVATRRRLAGRAAVFLGAAEETSAA